MDKLEEAREKIFESAPVVLPQYKSIFLRSQKYLTHTSFETSIPESFGSLTYSLLFVILLEETPALGVIGPSFIPALQKGPGAVDVTRPVRVTCEHTHARTHLV